MWVMVYVPKNIKNQKALDKVNRTSDIDEEDNEDENLVKLLTLINDIKNTFQLEKSDIQFSSQNINEDDNLIKNDKYNDMI